MRPFDVILTWPKHPAGFMGIISRIIMWATHRGPSHVRTYVKGLYGDFDFFETTFPRPRFGMMSEVDPKVYQIEIGRHKNLPYPLPPLLGLVALEEMNRLERETFYDVGELFENLFEEIGLDSIDNSDPNNFVCSSGDEHLRKMWKNDQYLWCPGHQLVSPADIRNSKFYVKVVD